MNYDFKQMSVFGIDFGAGKDGFSVREFFYFQGKQYIRKTLLDGSQKNGNLHDLRINDLTCEGYINFSQEPSYYRFYDDSIIRDMILINNRFNFYFHVESINHDVILGNGKMRKFYGIFFKHNKWDGQKN